MKINLKPFDFYTQRNNQYFPAEACMPTARVMFYLGNNIPFEAIDLADDYFMRLLRSDEAVEFCRQKYPWADRDGIQPNMVHGMYGSWLDEKVTGRRRSDFRQDLTFDQIVRLVDSGRIIMTSGKFPETKGHAVDIIGTDGPDTLILADPWGDYRTGYDSHSGYGILMSRADFERIISGDQVHKWGHVLLEDV